MKVNKKVENKLKFVGTLEGTILNLLEKNKINIYFFIIWVSFVVYML